MRFYHSHMARFSWRFNPENCQRHLINRPLQNQIPLETMIFGVYESFRWFSRPNWNWHWFSLLVVRAIRTIPPKEKKTIFKQKTKGAVVESPNINSTNTVNTCKLFMVTATNSPCELLPVHQRRQNWWKSSSREAPETSNCGMNIFYGQSTYPRLTYPPPQK